MQFGRSNTSTTWLGSKSLEAFQKHLAIAMIITTHLLHSGKGPEVFLQGRQHLDDSSPLCNTLHLVPVSKQTDPTSINQGHHRISSLLKKINGKYGNRCPKSLPLPSPPLICLGLILSMCLNLSSSSAWEGVHSASWYPVPPHSSVLCLLGAVLQSPGPELSRSLQCLIPGI